MIEINRLIIFTAISCFSFVFAMKKKDNMANIEEKSYKQIANSKIKSGVLENSNLEIQKPYTPEKILYGVTFIIENSLENVSKKDIDENGNFKSEFAIKIYNLFEYASSLLAMMNYPDRDNFEKLLKASDLPACLKILRDVCVPEPKATYESIFLMQISWDNHVEDLMVKKCFNYDQQGSSICIVYKNMLNYVSWLHPKDNKRIFNETLYLPCWILNEQSLRRANAKEEEILFVYLVKFLENEYNFDCDNFEIQVLMKLFRDIQKIGNYKSVLYTKFALSQFVASILCGNHENTFKSVASILREGMSDVNQFSPFTDRYFFPLMQYYGPKVINSTLLKVSK